MSKSVLCAIDISQPDKDADVLKAAATLAAMDHAQLDVITVVPDFGMSVVSGFFNEDHQKKMLTEAKHILKNQVINVLGNEASKDVRHVVTSGKTYQEILKVAETTKPSLIVIGGAQRNDLSDYLLGANAARVIRHSTCSVHVVR
jgi:nucleotide-binding universal stress UspA family protein